MKQIRICLFSVLLCLICFSQAVAKEMSDFAVYTPGSISLTGSSEVTGDVATGNGVVNLSEQDVTNIIRGNIYTTSGTVNITHKDRAQYGEVYTGQSLTFPNSIPGIPATPQIANQGGNIAFNQWWNPTVVTEDTHYSSITVSGLMVVDVQSSDRAIRAGSMTISGGQIILKGNHRLFLFVDSGISFGGIPVNQADASYNCPGSSENLHIICSSGNLTLSATKLNGNLYLRTGTVSTTGGAQVKGNVVIGGNSANINNNAAIEGVVYAPSAAVSMRGSGQITGSLVASSLSAVGGAKVNYKSLPLVIPEYHSPVEPPVDPPVDPPVVPPGSYLPGLLGEYYDTSNPTKETYKRLMRVDKAIEFNWMNSSPDPCIDSETFSVKWTGFITVPTSGIYTFYTFSDDGVRLTIDNKSLINRWGDVNLEFTASQPIGLSTGTVYPFKMEYQENYLNATIFLFWQSASQEFSLVPETAYWIDQPANTVYVNQVRGTGTGLLAEYFVGENGVTNGDPAVFTVNGEAVNHEWYDYSPNSSVPADFFSARWSGYIEGKYTENYNLEVAVDDGLRVWVNDVKKIDEWIPNSNVLYSASTPMENGGFTKIMIEYNELTGSATCVLYWSSEGQEREVIPRKYLYTAIPG